MPHNDRTSVTRLTIEALANPPYRETAFDRIERLENIVYGLIAVLEEHGITFDDEPAEDRASRPITTNGTPAGPTSTPHSANPSGAA